MRVPRLGKMLPSLDDCPLLTKTNMAVPSMSASLRRVSNALKSYCRLPARDKVWSSETAELPLIEIFGEFQILQSFLSATRISETWIMKRNVESKASVETWRGTCSLAYKSRIEHVLAHRSLVTTWISVRSLERSEGYLQISIILDHVRMASFCPARC
jgi:hypothetical protein